MTPDCAVMGAHDSPADGMMREPGCGSRQSVERRRWQRKRRLIVQRDADGRRADTITYESGVAAADLRSESADAENAG
jgi:hypothetical protein